jgi:hypothetical protein
MAAQNRSATLDLMGKGADAPALPSRRRTPDRITGRAVLSVARVAVAPAPTAGAVFYDKGAATAANFRPSYWSYDHKTAAADQQPVAPVAAPGRQAERELPPGAAAVADEPPAVVGLPPEPAATASHQPAAADELAATIEHVLGSRYTGARAAPESTEKPRLVGSAVTVDSLMAELAQARQARVGDSKVATSRQTVRAPKKATSLLDRAFAMGGVAIVLFALLALSPWRDAFLPNGLSHFFH